MPKKKYSINWENDEAVSFEVDGATYTSLDDVPNEKDRNKLAAMMQAAEDEDDFEDVKFDEKEFEELRKAAANPNVENIILRVFTGVAALMLLITAVASFFNIQKISREKSTDGVVVDMIQKREYINEQDRVYDDYYFPVVQFRAADGKTRRVQMSEGSNIPEYEKGDEVTILYDPEHPLDARIKSLGSSMLMWILPGITGILGVAFAGAVWMVRKFLLPETEPGDAL
jgi:hypothetical protein